MADHSQHAPDERAGVHEVSTRTYAIIFWMLMGWLVLTLGAAAVDIGLLNLPIAMVIACIKVFLVMKYFMHLKFNTKLTRFFALGALAFLAVMFLFTVSDYATRHWLPPVR
jgi:cytochrome c oxidase subunit 4